MLPETTPEGKWIVLRFAFPTRLKEGRFPTRQDLDAATREHPVYIRACWGWWTGCAMRRRGREPS